MAEEHISKLEIDTKVIKLWLDVLPNKVLCKLDKFKNAYDLWIWLIELHENPSRHEDKLRVDQFENQVEPKSTSSKIETGSLIEGLIGKNLKLILNFHIIYFKCKKKEHCKNKCPILKNHLA